MSEVPMFVDRYNRLHEITRTVIEELVPGGMEILPQLQRRDGGVEAVDHRRRLSLRDRYRQLPERFVPHHLSAQVPLPGGADVLHRKRRRSVHRFPNYVLPDL